MNNPKLAIFDLDGTVYRGAEVLPHAADVISKLLDQGVLVRYLTNNSGAIPRLITEKLLRFGVPCEDEWIYSAGHAARDFCRMKGVKSVLAVGDPGMHELLAEFEHRLNPDAVVVGICRTFTYDLMNQAMQAIRGGAMFVATNEDATYPVEGGRLEPGAGSIVKAIETCVGIKPEVMGKPHPGMVRTLLAQTGIAAEDAILIGDRLDTDIVAGQAAGTRTFLVLTGVEKTLPEGQPGGKNLSELVFS